MYLSDDLIQDHVFVNLTLDEMLDEMLDDVNHSESVIIINSNNYAAQYKCAAHFEKMQQIADKYNTKVIRCYGIPGHGKGKVDRVSGLIKVTICWEVGAGRKIVCMLTCWSVYGKDHCHYESVTDDIKW